MPRQLSRKLRKVAYSLARRIAPLRKTMCLCGRCKVCLQRARNYMKSEEYQRRSKARSIKPCLCNNCPGCLHRIKRREYMRMYRSTRHEWQPEPVDLHQQELMAVTRIIHTYDRRSRSQD